MLIPESQFPALIKDKGMKDSFIYLLATFLLSAMIFALEALAFGGAGYDTLVRVTGYLLAIVPWMIIAYTTYGIDYLLLR
ncbi:TPA: hypothetical protein EYP38_02750 [Candidatus Micrarchaeota archaeon]|nr:hypothetical protein [Candidatus Micrarchaeota archaeon]